jgi:hypothetical protein
MMVTHSVYLFIQSTSDNVPRVVRPRLNALVALREGLLETGNVRISASPQDADVHVEIVNLLGVDEGPIARAAHRSARVADRRRILIVRVTGEDDRFTFVCSDSPGTSAECHAARRIQSWMEGVRAAPHADSLSGAAVMLRA